MKQKIIALLLCIIILIISASFFSFASFDDYNMQNKAVISAEAVTNNIKMNSSGSVSENNQKNRSVEAISVVSTLVFIGSIAVIFVVAKRDKNAAKDDTT